MKDMITRAAKLRSDAAECKLISDLATNHEKRTLFARLAQRFDVLAHEVERIIAAEAKGEARGGSLRE